MTKYVIGDRPEKAVPLLVLDIDGTVREGKDDPLGKFVNGAEDVRVFPEAVTMMRRWKAGGGRIIGASNQGGIALGLVSVENVAEAMAETVRQAENLFDFTLYCPHHPAADDPVKARCWCRKPSPGLIITAMATLAPLHHEYYPPHLGLMVGDREEDEQCARLAGLEFMWAADWRAGAAAERRRSHHERNPRMTTPPDGRGETQADDERCGYVREDWDGTYVVTREQCTAPAGHTKSNFSDDHGPWGTIPPTSSPRA